MKDISTSTLLEEEWNKFELDTLESAVIPRKAVSNLILSKFCFEENVALEAGSNHWTIGRYKKDSELPTNFKTQPRERKYRQTRLKEEGGESQEERDIYTVLLGGGLRDWLDSREVEKDW